MKENQEFLIENKEKIRDTTLLFLVRKNDVGITKISLAMKKRGFGMGRWNGSGGKVESGENIDQAVDRETAEEIGVEVLGKKKVAELTFIFPHKPEWNQLVHVYFAEKWRGEMSETEEMKPEWFATDNIPFDSMWPDDKYWLPEVLRGNIVKAKFEFGEGDVILKKDVNIVSSL